MKRRDFLTASAAAGLTLTAPSVSHAAAAAGAKDLIELRLYTFESQAKLKTFDDFLRETAIPALNEIGIKPVGVFKLLAADNPKVPVDADSPVLYVLLPHKSMESAVRMIKRLEETSSIGDSAAHIIMAPKDSPAYKRFESSLLLGFDEAPRVEAPNHSPDRLLQLRIYESHNDERALKKIEMFNQGGEIAIFRRCGMTPVFFGQALVGSRLPNLTYMLSFANEAAMKEGWDKFGKDPGWKALREDEQYKDTVSNITNLILRPASSSQI